MNHATPVARGCGSRVEGGIYLELGVSPFGVPVEEFLLDPAVLPPPEITLSAQGVQLYRDTASDVWHVLDWIGSRYYPNVCDFVEEVRQFGLSRRLPKTLDFSKLTPESRILTAHSHAWVSNATLYPHAAEIPGFSRCPKAIYFKDKGHPVPTDDGQPCSGVWWKDLTGGEPLPDGGVVRKMPSFTYTGDAAPDWVIPAYKLAFFASFPVSGIVVVQGEGASEAKERASRSALEVEEVEQ